MTRYTITTCLCWGGDIQTGEAEVTATYAVEKGYPATGPSYSSGGEPGQPDMVVDVNITHVDDKPWNSAAHWESFGLTFADADGTLVEKLIDDREDEMLEAAADDDQSARDEWDDQRRQERVEDEAYWRERRNLEDES